MDTLSGHERTVPVVGRLNVVERTWVNRDVPDVVVDDGVKDRRAKLRAAYL